MASKKVKIDGVCPYCGTKNSIRLTNYYYGNSTIPYMVNVPVCSACDNDEIEIRKVNNRRYKIVGKW